MGDRIRYDVNNPRIPIFMDRFRAEVDALGGISKVCEKTGISRPTVSFWYNGERTPDAASLIVLSNNLNVSVDYLLGLTNVRNRDTDIQSVGEYTGLSEDSIAFLNRMKYSFIPRMIDFIIDDTRIQDASPDTFLKLLHFFLDYGDGNHSTRRINIYGDIFDSPLPKNGIRTDTIMLNESIIENAVLEEIKKRLLKQKEGYKIGKH